MTEILVAGIGNLFHGDDGFGSAVTERLAGRKLPAGVRVVDFGIRGLDLVYALLDTAGAAIFVDTVQRGESPGTLYLIEPEFPAADGADAKPLLLSPHSMEPHRVLRLAASLGAPCRKVLLVGCEPASFGDPDDGEIGLSPPVAAAVAQAADTVERLVRELIGEEAV